MLRGTREAILRKMQPVSIHGQLSYDLHYQYTDDPEGQPHVARVGPEAIESGVQVGDKVSLDFVVGVVTSVKKVP
jgi:hypothetical protein